MRAYKRIKRFYTDVQGTKYPGSDALTDAGPAQVKAYTEWMEQGSVGCSLAEYTHTNFYSLVDYTGAQNIFAIPQIQTEAGAKVANRFINFRLEFAGSPVAADDADIDSTGEKRVIIWHMAKKLLTWGPNMAMDIIE